jgi:hypothetical protein
LTRFPPFCLFENKLKSWEKIKRSQTKIAKLLNSKY